MAESGPDVAARSRRGFLFGLGALAAFGLSSSAAVTEGADGSPARTVPFSGRRITAARRTRPPNFVVILADDLGYGQLGCYGQRKVKTPRLDLMAREGLRFTDAYSAAPICAPARASLLTGLHGGHAPVRRNPVPSGDLPLGGTPTFATLLRDAGYRTGLYGKWGFGPDHPSPDHPDQYGFTDFCGYLTHFAAKNYYPERLWEGRQRLPLPGNTGGTGPLYGPDVIMDRALSFLRNASGPFMLLLTLPLPHIHNVQPPGRNPYADKKGWRRPDEIHAAQVTLLDTYVGRVLDELRAGGLADDTIVIFTGDNGPHEEGGVDPDFFRAAGPYRGYKRNLYEGGIRVPFIAWSPRLMAGTRGRTTAHPMAHYDLLATLADFASVPVPEGTDGLSLRKVLTGRPGAPVHEYLYWMRAHAGGTPRQRKEDHGRGRRAGAAVRFGRWKAVAFAPGPDYTPFGPDWSLELYDLEADPSESRNLAEKRPELVRRAERYLRDAWWPFGPGAGLPPAVQDQSDPGSTTTSVYFPEERL